mgnify:CR=1 FL=1
MQARKNDKNHLEYLHETVLFTFRLLIKQTFEEIGNVPDVVVPRVNELVLCK